MVNRFEALKIGLGKTFPDDPLFKATEEDNIAEIKRLLDSKEGDPNCVKWAYRQGLQCFVRSHDAFSLVTEAGLVIDERTLIDFLKFIEINDTDFKCEILQRLIDLGAPINGYIEKKAHAHLHYWPILVALSWGRVRYVETLLNNGANPGKLFLPDQLTPLHFAVIADYEHFVGRYDEDAYAAYIEQIEMLLDFEADIHARDCSGKTPILSAGEYVSAGAIGLLVERGACLLDVDNKGMGILSLAEKSALRGNSRFTPKKLESVVTTFKHCLITYYEVDTDTGEYIRASKQ